MAAHEDIEKICLQDDEEFSVFDDFVKKVLDKATVDIVEKLEPDGILDIFVERNILGEATYVTIRDIREKVNTSEKNREIREMVRRSSNNYITFKEGLASTGQQGLLDDLEALERITHDNEPRHCDSKVLTPTSKSIQDNFQFRYTELQQHLVRKYEEENIDWENPVTSEEARLSDMYVQPSVKRIREINDHREMKEVDEQKSELIYKDIFQSQTGTPCKNIYIAGDAGFGKTTFCNQLVINWCSAVQNKPHDSLTTEDQTLLSSFRLLFLISLRDTETTYHVEDMIQEQLLANAPGSLNISDILKTEKCLIILDGLDEWSCPGDAKKCHNINKDIPGRNTANKNCVFITTTRMWKYDVIGLKNRDVDKNVELSGIGEQSSEKLTKRMLDYLERDSQTNKAVDDFYSKIKENNLDEFLSVPVLLIQLVTMWFFDKDFGNSQLQLYCSMLDLMFERSEKNLPEEISKCSSTTVATTNKLPECLNRQNNCQKYSELLHCLARLAYKALFNKQKEEALVFKSSSLEIFGISPSDIKLCLQCGILAQCRDCGKRTGKYKKFSFLHKTVQECLAALYLVTNDKCEDILKEVKQLCDSVETMLEMNQVWLFVAGMDPDMTRGLFEHLAHVVNADERVKKYRRTVGSDYYRLIDDIQRCVFDLVSEGINNGQYYENVCLEDFSIDDDNVNDLKRVLFCSGMSKVKSLYIETGKLTAITDELQQCRSLRKLFLDEIWSSPLISLNPVEDLVENNCESFISLSMEAEITASDKLVTAICNSINKYLMALKLSGGVKLTHKHKEQILHSVSQSPSMSQLVLGLHCIDHGDKCDARIDWSAMTRLRELTLHSMSVDSLQSLPYCVEWVRLSTVTFGPVTSLLDFAHLLSQTKRKVTVELDEVTFTEPREEFGDLKSVLMSCAGLKLTWFQYNDMGRWDINFHTSSQ